MIADWGQGYFGGGNENVGELIMSQWQNSVNVLKKKKQLCCT
jgi:hypothetical protein